MATSDDRGLSTSGADRTQPEGVGVQRPRQHLLDRAALHDLAGVHDRQLVADLRYHRQVVRDEDQARSGLAAQPGQQPQYLVLDGHVQRGGGLVAEDQRRLARQRDCDHDALAHAAGELVRV